MLRRRVITVLTFVDGVLFRTKLFDPDYRYTLSFVDTWSIDEIVVLDISRSPEEGRGRFAEVVRNIAQSCFVPLAVGGGVRSVDQVKRYLDLGADKVVVNTGAVENPSLISDIAAAYGNQCCVVSIDAKMHNDRKYEVFTHFGTQPTGMTPAEWAGRATERGAGEILVNSIDRDGSLSGYDIDLCRSVTAATSVPVLICGGAGNWKHFLEGLTSGGADAVCTNNIYHFTEVSIQSAKTFLARNGIPVRQ